MIVANSYAKGSHYAPVHEYRNNTRMPESKLRMLFMLQRGYTTDILLFIINTHKNKQKHIDRI